MVDDIQSKTVNYTIECHGRNSMPLRSCLEVCFCDLDLLFLFMLFKVAGYLPVLTLKFCKVGCLQEVGSHPIFSPLRCRIPLPGFEKFRFCISLSQYEKKESYLLKNLCFALGAKFTEKAFKGVTHLICKFASGDKYEVYSKRGTPTITEEWLFECVKQVAIFYTWF